MPLSRPRPRLLDEEDEEEDEELLEPLEEEEEPLEEPELPEEEARSFRLAFSFRDRPRFSPAFSVGLGAASALGVS